MEMLKGLGEYGVLGILVFVLVLWCARLYRHGRDDARTHAKQLRIVRARLEKEQGLRVGDAQRMIDLVMKLQAELISSVTSINAAAKENAKLCDLVQALLEQSQELLGELAAARDGESEGR